MASDIETTGFEADDRVTVVGFALPLGSRVFVEGPCGSVDTARLESRLGDRFETTLNLTAHDGEAGLLEAAAAFLDADVAPREYLLVAYNGDRFGGGFDLPFLRTRFARNSMAWPFDGIPFADLLPIIRKRFNSTVDGESRNDLAGAYDALVVGELSAADPFADSEAAVAAYESGDVESLVAHNVADIGRTAALSSLARRYCGTSEFSLKSLTPTSRDPALSDPG